MRQQPAALLLGEQALRLAVTPELGPAVEMVQRGLAATMASVVLL